MFNSHEGGQQINIPDEVFAFTFKMPMICLVPNYTCITSVLIMNYKKTYMFYTVGCLIFF